MEDAQHGDTLRLLQQRLSVLLPEPYVGGLDAVQPTSMGSAALKFRSDGRVAWDEIWSSFCDLAMAGGPPHKGTLLEPGLREDIAAQRGRSQQVAEEICRGIVMVTHLEAAPSRTPGWVRVECNSRGMAGWLLRAITMENVAVWGEGSVIELPASPAFRLEKEIKNVVTVMAKTCHYWRDHTSAPRQQAMAELMDNMQVESPLLEPAFANSAVARATLLEAQAKLVKASGKVCELEAVEPRYPGWLGVEVRDVACAISIMRLLIATNVLARREGTVLFVPANPYTDPGGQRALQSLVRGHGFAVAQKIAGSPHEFV